MGLYEMLLWPLRELAQCRRQDLAADADLAVLWLRLPGRGAGGLLELAGAEHGRDWCDSDRCAGRIGGDERVLVAQGGSVWATEDGHVHGSSDVPGRTVVCHEQQRVVPDRGSVQRHHFSDLV